MLYRPKDWIEIVQELGLDGLEWRPFRGLTNTMILWNMVDKETLSGFIVSVEQSFRGERSLIQAYRHPNRNAAIKGYFVFPYISNMKVMAKLAQIMGEDFPVVMYPDRRLPYWSEKVPTNQRLFQLTQEVADKWFAPDMVFLKIFMEAWGFHGIVLDAYHIQAQSGGWVRNWSQWVPENIDLIPEVHIGLGRSEYPEIDSDPKAFLTGDLESSEQGRVLLAMRDLGWHGRVVLEIPPGTFLDPIKDHAAIALNIRRAFI
jgi:hypothetical protein